MDFGREVRSVREKRKTAVPFWGTAVVACPGLVPWTKRGRYLAAAFFSSPFFHVRGGALVTNPCLMAFAVTRM